MSNDSEKPGPNVDGREGETPAKPRDAADSRRCGSLALSLVAAILAVVALAIASYLSVQSLRGEDVAGCGGASGCAQVLSSRWATIGPVPVSLIGATAYLLVLAGLALRVVSQGKSTLGDMLLLALSPAMLIAAGWFTYLQVVELEAFCKFCMIDHGLGVVLGVLLLIIAWDRQAWARSIKPIAVGAVLATLMVMFQLSLPEQGEVITRDNPFADRDGDAWIDGRRYVSLFSGALQFELQDVPTLGDVQAKQVVAVVFDYGCPHCRKLHRLLDDAIEEDPSRFVVVPLPITIHPKNNPYTYTEQPAFEDSYERAKLSLAVAAIDRAAWHTFDRWLFALDGGDFPRSAKDARAKAAELVGESALKQQLTGEALEQHRATINRTIELLGLIEPPIYIPIVTTPGAPRHLTESFDDLAVLETLLQEAAANLAGQKLPAEAP